MGSPFTRDMVFLPIFSFLHLPFSTYGQAREWDRQTDRRQADSHERFMPHPKGAGHSN